MYMGNIVEFGTIEDVLTSPAHPYTKALLKSIPVLGRGKKQRLDPIRGNTPDSFTRPPGCQFRPRCDYATGECALRMPDDETIEGVHRVMCYHYAEVLKNA
jgi:peptide/nickel transport system ATP-binding protein